jgi:hypothetical protein
MKSQADKHRSEREFLVGDFVYHKVQPYVQIYLAPRSCQKLSYHFFGLELPPQVRIHNVVHVSQLKKYIPPDTSVVYNNG